MSLETMAWALRTDAADGPLERVVLVCLGDEATPEGVCASPDWGDVATVAVTSVEAVERAVGRLRTRGVIDETPIGWVLNVPWVGLSRPTRRPPAKARISEADRVATYERDGWACLRCGDAADLSIDHVIPESAGGPSDQSNYQTLCRSCNSWKGIRVGPEFDYRPIGARS